MEWDDATRGKHDGSVADASGALVRYFECAAGRGSFMKPALLSGPVDMLDALRERYEDDETEVRARRSARDGPPGRLRGRPGRGVVLVGAMA